MFGLFKRKVVDEDARKSIEELGKILGVSIHHYQSNIDPTIFEFCDSVRHKVDELKYVVNSGQNKYNIANEIRELRLRLDDLEYDLGRYDCNVSINKKQHERLGK